MSAALPDSTTPCVLIVDDDELVLHALETMISGAGYPVVATGDPLVALQGLHDFPVSVLIADQRMDAMSGLELLDHARRLQPHASRILITGMLSVKMLTEAVNCGEIYRFIAKPWSSSELTTTIHNAVQRYQLLRENAALHAETLRLNEHLLAEKRMLESRVAQFAADKTELERSFDHESASHGNIFHLCAATLTAFDNALAARTRRTVELCGCLADAAGLAADLRGQLIATAWFHDLGLIAVARDLHEAAGAALHDHPAVSERLALAAGLGEAVAAAVRAHHESFDGGGFPDRLRGRQIPEAARWLTPVAYFVGSGLSRERVIEELERLSGVAFDPHVVPHLLRLVLGQSSSGTTGTLETPVRTQAVVRRAYSQAGSGTSAS